jgi:hypothetical protein
MAPGPSPPYRSTVPPVLYDTGLRGVLVQQEINRLFHFADSQVVLQVSQSITRFPSNLLTISIYTGGRTDVQNPSVFPDSGVPLFQRFIFAPSNGGLRKCGGFRQQPDQGTWDAYQ